MCSCHQPLSPIELAVELPLMSDALMPMWHNFNAKSSCLQNFGLQNVSCNVDKGKCELPKYFYYNARENTWHLSEHYAVYRIPIMPPVVDARMHKRPAYFIECEQHSWSLLMPHICTFGKEANKLWVWILKSRVLSVKQFFMTEIN